MYEPYYAEPLKELEVCLVVCLVLIKASISRSIDEHNAHKNFYEKLTKKVRRWDGMEIENWLSCRDGIKSSIEKLRKNVINVSSYLKRVKKMDEKLFKEIEYVQKALDGYMASDDYDISHWWWYLDAVAAGKMKIVFNQETGMYEGIGE